MWSLMLPCARTVTAPVADDDPLMAEVEPGHMVTCATVDEDGGCVQNKPVSNT
jgi:hypothetical protein